MATLFTVEFLLGFWIFFIIYWLAAPLPKVQNGLLLLGGYYFVYLTGVYSLMVLLAWSVCVWLVVKLAEKKGHETLATLILVALMMFWFIIFKYCMPLADWLRAYLETKKIALSLPVINILLPLGLSFYLFNSVSLVRAVAKKEISNPDIISVLLYINFIPTLIAGPVNRATALFPQILASQRSILNLKGAFYLIALALVKLFFASSWLSEMLVNPVFSLPTEQNGWDTIIAIYGWAWNIYFNFSGYTNLVTGIAMLLGYRLPKNFAHPYMAASLQHFWRSWHISLSNFIRDYVYFPLGGSRGRFSRTQVNAMIAMVLSGLWHGAGITFLLWGAIHGAGLVIYNIWSRWRHLIIKRPLPETLARLLTFHYVCFAWIFFRADSLEDALVLVKNILHVSLTTLNANQFWTLLFFVLITVIYPWIVNLRNRWAENLHEIRWYAVPLIIIPVLAVAFFFAPSGVPEFIYANF